MEINQNSVFSVFVFCLSKMPSQSDNNRIIKAISFVWKYKVTQIDLNLAKTCTNTFNHSLKWPKHR